MTEEQGFASDGSVFIEGDYQCYYIGLFKRNFMILLFMISLNIARVICAQLYFQLHIEFLVRNFVATTFCDILNVPYII